MNFCIYYRGQVINTVQAKTASAALKTHLKSFALGKLGTTVALAEAEPQDAHLRAREVSNQLPAAA